MKAPFLIIAVIIIIAAFPLAMGLIPINSVYGIRNEKTMSDEQTWRRANTFGATAYIIAATVYILAAIYLKYHQWAYQELGFWTTHMFAFLTPLSTAFLTTLCYIKRQ